MSKSEPQICFVLKSVQSLALDAESLPPYGSVRADGKHAVLALQEFNPLSPLVNGWQPGNTNTALLVEDDEWNPIVAKVPDGSGRWAAIGGTHFIESTLVAMEQGPTPRWPDWRIWTFHHNQLAEFCELMRVHFERRRLQQAKFLHSMVPNYRNDHLANLTAEEFMDEAVTYHEAVYKFWQQFTH